MDKIDVKPKSEEEFLAMVEMHNLYHSHEPETASLNLSGYGHTNYTRCRVCNMPLESVRGNLETFSRKGNVSVYEHANIVVDFTKANGFPFTWYLAWMLKNREFNLVEHLARYTIADRRYGSAETSADELLELFSRWFNPVFAIRNGIKSQNWARAAFIYARSIGVTDAMRINASLDPVWALEFAAQVDKKPHDVTRNGACRHMETAMEYASGVDGGYHIATFSKALEQESTSLKYLSGNVATMDSVAKEMIKARWVRDSRTAMEYAKIVGPDDQTRALVAAGGDANDMYSYAKNIDKAASDVIRNAIVATGNVAATINFAAAVDKCGHDVTRKLCCTTPVSAYEYARLVDKAARDDTREAASKDPTVAVSYAMSVDAAPHDVTRLGASASPEKAYEYAVDVDRCGHPVTRKAACGSMRYAMNYAEYVDKAETPETFEVCAASSSNATRYARCVSGHHDRLKAMACLTPETAFQYAVYVDQRPSNETRRAAYADPAVAERYKRYEESYYVGFVGELFSNIPKEEANV